MYSKKMSETNINLKIFGETENSRVLAIRTNKFNCMTEEKQNTKKSNQQKPPKKPQFNIYWIYGAIALLIIGMQFFSGFGSNVKETTWKDFKNNMLTQHDVERIVVVNKQKVEVYIKRSSLGSGRYQEFSKEAFNSGPHYYFTIGSVEYFEKQMDEAQQN